MPRGPVTAVLHPCLRIMQNLICPVLPGSKPNQKVATTDLCSMKMFEGNTVDYRAWLNSDRNHEYAAWSKRMPSNNQAKLKNAKDQNVAASGGSDAPPKSRRRCESHSLAKSTENAGGNVCWTSNE